MKIEKGNIYSFKLTSGQELVAKLVDFDNEYYHIEKPLTIGNGPKGMEFLPVMVTAPLMEDSALRATAIAMVSPPREDVLESYKDSVDPKKILTPHKKIIHG